MLLSKVSGINAKDFGDELAADWEEDDRAQEREREVKLSTARRPL